MDNNSVGQGSITEYLGELKSGNLIAVEKLWHRYFAKLVAFAKRKSALTVKTEQDEEDFAIVAFTQFIKGVEKNAFRKLENRGDLWQILAMITSRRISNAHRRNQVRKDVLTSILTESFDEITPDEILGEPCIPVLDGLCENCHDLLRVLKPRHREVAKLRLAGYSNREIAERLEVSVATVERDLSKIRDCWTLELMV